MDGWQLGRRPRTASVVDSQSPWSGRPLWSTAAVQGERGHSLFELLVVCAILAGLAALIVIPQYARYARARQVDDAAALLAQDIAYLERFAQNSEPYEGATIEVKSNDPLAYTCYSGRPTSMDGQSHIRGVLIVREFADVALVPGALSRNSPFLFAHNGSVQYVQNDEWADQHAPVTIELRSTVEHGRSDSVDLNPFTGAVSAP